MNDTWALVPVKTPGRAKTRLAPVLDADEAAALSEHMLADMLDALAGAQAVQRTAVVTADAGIAALARAQGCEVLADPPGSDINGALTAAARAVAARGAHTVLILPGDLPTVRAADIDALLTQHTGGLSLCPASRDGGTNVLVVSPPAAIEFRFGADSAAQHLTAAAQAGIHATQLSLPAFQRDIDVPEDLLWLSAQPQAGHTARYLQNSGISARLQAGAAHRHTGNAA